MTLMNAVGPSAQWTSMGKIEAAPSCRKARHPRVSKQPTPAALLCEAAQETFARDRDVKALRLGRMDLHFRAPLTLFTQETHRSAQVMFKSKGRKGALLF